jgi:DNA-directed RNA polymerase specialized sigma24 family protein
MGSTGQPDGEPGPAPGGTGPGSRQRRQGAAEAAPRGGEQEACPDLAHLYHTHHRSLIRLAALLTGDTGTAETVVVDSFVALNRTRKSLRTWDDALPYLRRLVVARSRSAARRHRPAGGEPAAPAERGDREGGPRQPPPFEDAAIVRALRALPSAQREAAVLRLYLDLDDEQAAAAMRVSQAALRRHLAAARTALSRALGWSP